MTDQVGRIGTAVQRGRLVVVTGTDTGIGAATARELARSGYHVLAGVLEERNADTVRADGIEPIVLDVTRPEQVAALADRVAADPAGRLLRAVVNNAGIEMNAPVEVLPLQLWRDQLEVNLLGPVSVTQALLPHLRRSRGTIVNVSSVGGVLALPICGAYAASKFGLEGMSDALRREVAPQGIRVVIVQPGGVRTAMADRSGALSLELAAGMSADHTRLYGDLVAAAVASQSAFLEHAMSAERAAATIARVATIERPRARYTLGSDAARIIPLARILPTRLMDRLLTGDRAGAGSPRSSRTRDRRSVRPAA